MKEEKFTKGDWKADQIKVNGEPVEGAWCVTASGFSLASVRSGPTFGVIDEIQKANAHLIAAAPEMYETLKTLADYLSCMDGKQYEIELEEKINSLLARARGEL